MVPPPTTPCLQQCSVDGIRNDGQVGTRVYGSAISHPTVHTSSQRSPACTTIRAHVLQLTKIALHSRWSITVEQLLTSRAESKGRGEEREITAHLQRLLCPPAFPPADPPAAAAGAEKHACTAGCTAATVRAHSFAFAPSSFFERRQLTPGAGGGWYTPLAVSARNSLYNGVIALLHSLANAPWSGMSATSFAAISVLELNVSEFSAA
jgi:hypothetical protein